MADTANPFVTAYVPTSNYSMTSDNKTIIEGNTLVETAKDILNNTDAILQNLEDEVTRINDALYGRKERPTEMKEPQDLSMLATLRRQRDWAEQLLKGVCHIREALW